MSIINWIIGGFQRVQSAYKGYMYRVNVATDTVGPTVVSIFRGN
jgi:hypothetical protein